MPNVIATPYAWIGLVCALRGVHGTPFLEPFWWIAAGAFFIAAAIERRRG